MSVKPDRKDIEAIEHQYGPLPENASLEERAERYRLWQAHKLIREQGLEVSLRQPPPTP
jgi:hypothetical protein